MSVLELSAVSVLFTSWLVIHNTFSYSQCFFYILPWFPNEKYIYLPLLEIEKEQKESLF